MTNIPLTTADLERHLTEQLTHLQLLADSFDTGNELAAKFMTVPLRTLLHDPEKGQSKSVLKQLGKKETVMFYDSSLDDHGLIGPYTGLVMKSVGASGGKYVAPLDDFPPGHSFKSVSFADFWTKTIFVDGIGNRFSRETLIMTIATKDGGAHVDPSLGQDYVEFTQGNSLGWISDNAVETKPFGNASFAAVRQVAHEVLKTLTPGYPEKKLLNTANAMVFGDIHIQAGFAGRIIGPR